jgi:hypothetical protein
MFLGITPFDIIIILIIILLILLVPMLLRSRILSGVTRATLELEDIVQKSEEMLIDVCKERGNPSGDPKMAVQNFMEFFVIPPVDLDPYGVVSKLDKILEMSEERFQYMASEVAPEADDEWKSNIIMALKSTLGINMVAKQVRHNLELAKKTGNLQILLMLQMSLPLLMRIVKAQFEGSKAFSEGKPIGDGLGPLVAGMIMAQYSKGELREQGEMVMTSADIQGRKVTVARAKGPGARVGKVGKTVVSLIESEGINRVITVDAAAKLEGEKTGAVAEGIGVVIGGPGADKWIIEEEMLKKDLQIDAVIIKMSPEEAISPLKKELLEAAQKALLVVENAVLRSNEGSKVLLVGVGNSCGLPNIIQDLTQIEVKKEDTDKKKR